MKNYISTVKEAVKDYNNKNPDKRELNLSSLAEKIGTSKQWVSQINTVYIDQLNLHSQVVFMSDDKDFIRKTWEHYVSLKNDKLTERLEKIRVVLDCEIWDLIKEEKL